LGLVAVLRSLQKRLPSPLEGNMTDTESIDTRSEGGIAEGAAVPPPTRLLRIVALAALIVAVYAAVQIGIVGGDSESDGAGETRLLDIGSVAPDFTVRTLDGGEFSLSRHVAEDGRPVFLNMWAEWCFPCRAEMPAIDAVAAAHPEVHFIGVVVDDDEADARRFVDEYGIRYQIGLDDDRVVKNAYDIWAMPSTYLLDGDGVIVDRVFGPMQERQLEEMIAELSVAASD
jgi:thiol-disulfide isomerase/thioredoxin